MSFILDNLSATIIASALLLVVAVIQMRMNEMRLEQTANYVVKTQAADLATWLEDDLLMLAQHMKTEAAVPFRSPSDSTLADGTVVTTNFTFYRDSVYTNASNETVAERVETRYRLVPAGRRLVEGDSVDVFGMQREQCLGAGCLDAGGGANAGGSAPMLSYFKIDMLNRDARAVQDPATHAVAAPDTIQNTRLRFAMLTPFGLRKNTVRRVYYGSTLLVANQ